MIWTQTLTGRMHDLLDPQPEDIDFREIAETLSKINRFAGATEKPVSVALHSLIAAQAARPEDRAAVLLHDAHEAYIGDITSPVARAIAAICATLEPYASIPFATALNDLKRRHDLAIYAAAGLPLPDEAQRRRIHKADIIALRTERRDFMAPPPAPWTEEIEAAPPLPRKYRYCAPPDIADELYAQFRAHLPALRVRAA